MLNPASSPGYEVRDAYVRGWAACLDNLHEELAYHGLLNSGALRLALLHLSSHQHALKRWRDAGGTRRSPRYIVNNLNGKRDLMRRLTNRRGGDIFFENGHAENGPPFDPRGADAKPLPPSPPENPNASVPEHPTGPTAPR